MFIQGPKGRAVAEMMKVEESEGVKEEAEASTSLVDDVAPKKKKPNGKKAKRAAGDDAKPPPSKKKKKAVVSEQANENAETNEQSEAKDFDQLNNTKIKLDASRHSDLVNLVIDEICLEGLDGITIEALWTRISDATSETLPLTKHVEEFIWNVVRSVDRIRFYELPEARPALVVFNRFKYFDWETGHVIEPDKYPSDIYPFAPISDKIINTPTTMTNNLMGSCSTFETRKEVTEVARNLSLQEAEVVFGSKLVMVADQPLRTRSLISENADPTIKLSHVQYCILERIGRSRRLGEVTAGQNSLLHLGDSKTLFYLRKQLVKHNFITKQPFCIRNKSGNSVGLLFHLRKFYTEHKSKKQTLIEQVVEILKKKPKYRMEYIELKKVIGFDTWSKGGLQKLLKSPDFKQFVQTDLTVPYRTMYPNALPKEWKHKSSPKEKGLRVLQLINPFVNVSAVYREEDQKDESSDDEPIGDYPFNISIFNHTYNLIFEAGADGLSLKQLQKILGLEFYLARSILNNMVKRKIVDTSNVDIGRQHIIKYYARCFNDQEFRAEHDKAKEEGPPAKPAAEACDDDVLEFIAGVLKVDKDCLKPKGAARPPETQRADAQDPLRGGYDFVKDFRRNNRLEKHNAFDKNKYLKQLALKDDADAVEVVDVAPASSSSSTDKHAKDGYDEILRNFHLHYPMELSVRERRVEGLLLRLPDPILSFAPVDLGSPQSFLAQYEVAPLQASFKPKKSPSKSRLGEARLLGSTEAVGSLLRSYFFVDIRGDLLATFASWMEQIERSAGRNELVFPSELESDDECCDGDDWSVVVFAGDSRSETIREPPSDAAEIDDFKRILLADFENPKFCLGLELNLCSSKRPLEQLDEEQECKRPKLGGTASEGTENVVKMNMFMGANPVVSSQTIDEDGIETTIVISTTPEKYAELGAKYEDKQMSERSLARANFIIETVSREKMISDLSKLTNMLKMVEKKNKCLGTIDKKTLDRLLYKLVVRGHVKMVKIVLKYDTVARVKNMICSPPVNVNTVVQSTIEQMKMSFFIYAKRKTTENSKPVEDEVKKSVDFDCNDSLHEMDALLVTTTAKTSKFRYSRIIGKQYGYVPKFAKFKILHEVLFYLVYAYDGEEVGKEDVPRLLKQLNVKPDDVNSNELSPIYKRELSWKMFVSPLPNHKNWTKGWALVCDIILRLPLSIFVKIYNISYIIPELLPLLNHPLKRHFLLKHVPPNIRNGFLSSRKYIFAIHEMFCHLCYLGLLQFGAQKLRDKDQQFVYLNCNAILYDTVSSAPGYHQISPKDYPKLSFSFRSEADVEEYWSKMWSVSMSTKLGQRYSQLDKTITLQDIHGKPAMIRAMSPKTPQTALEADVGYVPGDRLGACCLDSSTWVHVKRNWIWASHSKRSRKAELPPGAALLTGLRKKHLEQVKIKPIKYRDLHKEIKKKQSKREGGDAPQGGETKKLSSVKKKISSRRKLPVYRKVLARPPTFRKNVRTVDDVDSKIISKMGKTRSIWSEEEDITLVLCKTAANFLCPPNVKTRIVPYTAIRDVIHRLCPNKRKKPSTAYTRRYLKIIKSEDLEGKQKFFYNLDNDRTVQKYFVKFKDNLTKEASVTDEQVCIAFIYLASYATDHYKRSYRTQQKKLQEAGCIDYLVPEDMHKFDRSLAAQDADVLYHEPCGEDDIKIDVIKSVVHCSLGWKSDSSELPLMLYRIYQAFPDCLLRSAIMCLREQQIISGKKTLTKHINVKEVISVGGSQIHSSFAYCFKQITKYPDYIFPEANEFFAGVHKYRDANNFLVKNFEQGHGIGLSEMATKLGAKVSFEVPDEFLVLDPNISDHSELFQELAMRFRLMLSKRNVAENSDENEQESHGQLEKMIERVFDAYTTVASWKGQNSEGQTTQENNRETNEAATGESIRMVCEEVSKEEEVSRQKLFDGEEATMVMVDDVARKTEENNQLASQKLPNEGEASTAMVDDATGKPEETEPKLSASTQTRTIEESDQNANPTSNVTIPELRLLAEGRQSSDEAQKMLNITDLAYLLTKGLFPERDDEERLEKLHRHFLLMFPCSSFGFEDLQEDADWYQELLGGYSVQSEKLFRTIETECIIKTVTPSEHDLDDVLGKAGANVRDLETAKGIVSFTMGKSEFGATSQELKDEFPNEEGDLDLCAIVSVLLDKGVIARVGICSIRFVHVQHAEIWTIRLDEQRTITEDDGISLGMRMKLMPWIQIDGTVNVKILTNWLGIVLSHCMSFPFVNFAALAKRFNFLKPVDVFYLVEYLQDLCCVRLMAYVQPEATTLFSRFARVGKRRATMMDDFRDVFVETDNLAAVKFGAYWNKGKVDVATPFDV